MVFKVDYNGTHRVKASDQNEAILTILRETHRGAGVAIVSVDGMDGTFVAVVNDGEDSRTVEGTIR